MMKMSCFSEASYTCCKVELVMWLRLVQRPLATHVLSHPQAPSCAEGGEGGGGESGDEATHGFEV